MIKIEKFHTSVFVTDYTHYNEDGAHCPVQWKGVVISPEKSEILASFLLANESGVEFEAINLEHNPALLKRADGSLASQCECVFKAVRHDNQRPWMLLLELKYCQAKNIKRNIGEALGQLKKSYLFLRDEKHLMGVRTVKPYFVISTPENSPWDVSDASFFDQDDLLEIKKEYDGAQLYYTNSMEVVNTSLLKAFVSVQKDVLSK